MSRYSLAATKTSGAAAGMIVQLRTGSARDLRIFEIGVTATTAVSGAIGLIRPSAVGATFTSTAAGQPEDPSYGAGVAVIDTAATTAPTIGSTYMRQITLPATIGAGVIWTFSNGLVVPTSASIAIWQTSALAVGYAVYFCFEE
jgi:hypothetical protein